MGELGGHFLAEIIFNNHYKYAIRICEFFDYLRSLPRNNMDIDCESICHVGIALKEFSFETVKSMNRTNICNGISGEEYCSLGKKLTRINNVKCLS